VRKVIINYLNYLFIFKVAVSAAPRRVPRQIFELVPEPGPAQPRFHDHPPQLANNFAKEKSENRFFEKVADCPSLSPPSDAKA
jgi:hypothetical protein